MPRTGKSLPLLLAGLVGAAAWQNRSKLGELFQSVKNKADAAGVSRESIPDDYDRDRPSVFNSTAMAGPRGGPAATVGLDGGSMGTASGTQGEGAI